MLVETKPVADACSGLLPWKIFSPSRNLDVATTAVAVPPNTSVKRVCRPSPCVRKVIKSPDCAACNVNPKRN